MTAIQGVLRGKAAWRSVKPGRTAVILLSLLAVVLWLLPYLYLASSAFKSGNEVISTSPTFWPKTPMVENFQKLFARMDVWGCLSNSLVPSLVSTVLAVLLGALFAYGVSRAGGRVSILLSVLILCMKMIPTACIVVPIFKLVIQWKLYDTRMALILAYTALNLPFVIWTMLGFFQGLPKELEEAACIDGATPLKTFTGIVLPISKPALATAFIFTLFLAWNDFLVALLLTSSRTQTFTVGLANFLSAYTLDLGPMCAGAFLFSFPVMILCVAAQKYILVGMTAGSIKG